MFKSLLKGGVLALPLLFSAFAVHAEIIRFNFDTESFYNRTDAVPTHTFNSDGSGNAFGLIGLNASVIGTVDVNRSVAGVDTISDYSLQVVVPHGVTPGFGSPSWTVQYFSSTLMQPGQGATAEVFGSGYLSISQEFMFDPFYGPAVPQNTFYDMNIRQEYLFRVDLLFSTVAGAGPNGGNGFSVDRVDVRCAVPGDARLTCNAFGQVGGSNYSDWSSTEGLADSFAILPASGQGPTISGPTSPTAAVPTPPVLPLLLTAFGAMLLARRRG